MNKITIFNSKNYTILIIILLVEKLFSQTTISSGNVSGTWTKAGSPYKIMGEIIWTTKDSINSYTIVITNDKNIINGFFYGIFVNIKDTFYYKATCEDFIISDSCISFNINEYYFSKSNTLIYNNIELFKYDDFTLLLPNKFKGILNSDSSMSAIITTKTGLGNFEECIFVRSMLNEKIQIKD